MKRILSYLFRFLIISSLTVFPQNVDWEFLGLDDKIINNILISDSNHIFVTVEPGAVYKSTESGNTWIKKKTTV